MLGRFRVHFWIYLLSTRLLLNS
jgi:uracil phosphoribosyltransferase